MIVLALLLSFSGWTCLCLAMERHRRVVRATPWPSWMVILLRMAGAALLLAALGPLVIVWPFPIALTAWFGLISLAQLAFVIMLTYRPKTALQLAAAGAPVAGLGLLFALSGLA